MAIRPGYRDRQPTPSLYSTAYTQTRLFDFLRPSKGEPLPEPPLLKRTQDPSGFESWLTETSPNWNWDWKHLAYIRERLARVTAGSLKRLMLFLPPRSGKSEMTTIRYPVYRLETQADFRVGVGCYNQTFAERFGRKARRIARDRIELSEEKGAAKEWETRAGGVFRSCGVGSPPMGEGFDLLILDDPVKSREEADSAAYRERVWEWYRDDLFTRLEPGAAIVLIATRWHSDDLPGRLLEQMETGGDTWEVVSLPALAEEDDPLGRAPGEALCPDRFDVPAIEAIRAVQGYSFEALYQQRPHSREGDFFKVGMVQIVDVMPVRIVHRVRYWDLASAAPGKGDFSSGALLALDEDGFIYVEHVRRGQWVAQERDQVILQTAALDAAKGAVPIYIEQAPGLAKEPVENLVRKLLGYNARPDVVHRDKVSRAEPWAAQMGAGNVRFLQDEPGDRWNQVVLDTHRAFPNGKHDDDVDACSGACLKLSARLPAMEFY